MIESLSNLKGAALRQAIEVAVLRKGLDAQQAQGEAAVELIEQSGQVLRTNLASAHPHKGHQIDLYL